MPNLVSFSDIVTRKADQRNVLATWYLDQEKYGENLSGPSWGKSTYYFVLLYKTS